MEWLAPVLQWLEGHAHATGFIVALIALGESLALVGLFVPGAVLLFGVGALIGTGYLDFRTIALWAVAGAVIGDGVSFWLGRRYGDHLRDFWPLRRYPELYDRGIAFFRRHGGKSVLFGRFFGPMRPVIPAVAGVMGMSRLRFFTVNLLSALLWAPLYLFPGMVFAASLSVAAEVATRLVTLLLTLIGALWVAWWLIGRLRLWVGRVAGVLARALPGKSGWLHPLSVALRSLNRRAGLAWWLAAGALAVTVTAVLVHPSPAEWEQIVMAFASDHRSAWSRLSFLAVTQLGETPVIIATALIVTAFLVRRCGREPALVFGATIATGLGAAYLLKALIGAPRPEGVMDTVVVTWSFPSAHAAGIAVLCTAVATLVAPPGHPWRNRIFGTAAAIGAAVAVSRVALGVHWPMDVIGGLALGAMVGAGPALFRYRRMDLPRRRLAVLAPLTLIAAAAVAGALGWQGERTRYPGRSQPTVVDAGAWWRDGAGVPTDTGTTDIRFDAQWLAGPDAAELMAALRRTGWRRPAPWGLEGALRWLSPQPEPLALPVLPYWHGGRLPSLVRVLPVGTDARLVLRAWSGPHTRAGDVVWLLALSHAQLLPGWPLVELAVAPVATDVVGDWLQRWADAAGLNRHPGRPPRLAPAGAAAVATRYREPLPQRGAMSLSSPSRSSTRATMKSTSSPISRGRW